MNTGSKPSSKRRLVVSFFLSCVLFAGNGCQTFSLTQEQWAIQQRGGMADPEVGNAVTMAGMAAVFGTFVGAAVAAGTR